MRSPCDPPKFDEQDWRQFDFTRWHLDGLATGDAAAAALTELAQRFFATPEWRQHFAAAMPQVENAGRELYRRHVADLQQERVAAERDLDERIAAAAQRAEDHRRTVAAGAEPPSIDPDPQTYRVAVKVVDQAQRTGLEGLVVRVADPESRDAVLAETVTDADGNAVLSIPPERARDMSEVHTSLAVATPEGQVLARLEGELCIRLNQTETKIVRLPSVPEIEPYVKAALETRAFRERQTESLSARVERLRAERESRLRDIDCSVKNTEDVLAAFERRPEPDVIVRDEGSPPTGPGRPTPERPTRGPQPPSRGETPAREEAERREQPEGREEVTRREPPRPTAPAEEPPRATAPADESPSTREQPSEPETKTTRKRAPAAEKPSKKKR